MVANRRVEAIDEAISLALEREDRAQRLRALLDQFDEEDGPLPDDPEEDARIIRLLGGDTCVSSQDAAVGIPNGILGGMATTTIKVDTRLRDRILGISRDFGASSLAETIERLIDEHEAQAAVAAYDALRADPDEWADYRKELAEWDAVTADVPRGAE